ncbi:tRNA lysidine(34) synthetase TilS [Oceanispirochaeta crateris]|uniref:tRNA(Ile)-lysidine synthase n=1 Tax=Oceanispirochaeta crateris TaxID=2518645 RepID=A0A5C1QHZ1_9SPIO|nr:tRNA lysidine(34) synthetase TilS [Oceanispirochaeta crateris]QEN07753.1 tRNA lysidine(34) synthetase TilS [Oceanispirochaeta crateris]
MKSIQKKVETQFYATLSSQLSQHKRPLRIVTAFSGGPDSTALLVLLQKFRTELNYTLEAAYVNHGIRPADELSQEELKVERLTSEMNIPLHQKNLMPGFLTSFALKKHTGVEAAARLYRYRFFDRIMQKSEVCSLTALGHNRNDQEETILMRLFSGGGLEGLKGIPEERENLIRPLIQIDRLSIMSYLESIQIAFVHDSSNFEKDYLRNKIRLDLMRQIGEIFPEGTSSLHRLREDTLSILNHYNSLIDEQCPWTSSGGRRICNFSDFKRLPLVSQRSLLLKNMNLIMHSRYSDNRIPRSFFNPLESLSDDKGMILKGHGIQFYKKQDRLILEQIERSNQWDHFFFNLNLDSPYRSDRFTLELKESCGISGGDKVLDLPQEVNTLIVRSPLSATELRPYTKKKQDSLTLLCSGRKVLCVIDADGEILYSWRENKKRLEIGRNTNHLCVIIIVRGDYAPGRK